MDQWAISSFRDEFRFLSNFYPSPIKLSGVEFPTVEHAYQAGKTDDAEEWERLSMCRTPGEAKREGAKLKLRSNWDEVKFPLMVRLVHKKFQDPKLRYMLNLTGSRVLVEGNTWHDLYWGMCVCEVHNTAGVNRLGEILMAVRERNRNG